MKGRRQNELAERMAAAVDDLKSLIRAQHPGAAFEVGRDPDSPADVLLFALVDIDENEDIFERVLDPVMGRVLAFQIEEGLPVHVIPVRPPTGTRRKPANQQART